MTQEGGALCTASRAFPSGSPALPVPSSSVPEPKQTASQELASVTSEARSATTIAIREQPDILTASHHRPELQLECFLDEIFNMQIRDSALTSDRLHDHSLASEPHAGRGWGRGIYRHRLRSCLREARGKQRAAEMENYCSSLQLGWPEVGGQRAGGEGRSGGAPKPSSKWGVTKGLCARGFCSEGPETQGRGVSI